MVARVSKLRSLPTEVQDGVSEMLSDGKTIDAILDFIHDAGFDWVNRSAVGRFTKSLRPSIERVRESRAIASVLTKRLGDTSADVGRANVDLLQSLVMRISENIMGQADVDIAVDDILRLSTAVERLSKSQKNSVQALAAAREEGAKIALRDATKNIRKVAKKGGISDDALELIQSILK